MYRLILFFLALSWGSVQAQELYTEGDHYMRLAKKQPTAEGKVEVIEFFSYGCPHCKDFDPYIKKWKSQAADDVKVTIIPVVFSRQSWRYLAQAFYAIEMMDNPDKGHAAIFRAIHEQNKPHGTPEQLGDIVAAAGIDRKAFLDNMNSFAVDSKIREGDLIIKNYQITSVPSVAVDGLYMAGGRLTNSFLEVIQVLDFLVAKSRG